MHFAHRRLHAKSWPASSDYDTSNSIETRKYLRTYGLTPPAVETFDNQLKRCQLSIQACILGSVENSHFLQVSLS